MKAKVKALFNKYGLWLTGTDINPYQYSVSDYKAIDKDKVEAHKEFLKSIEVEENNRLNLIESKTSQLVSQTGIIFSLLSLFIPIFIDKISDQALIIRLLFLIVLILAFLFYMMTIRNAIKNFNIKNFVYSKPSPTNILKYQDKTVTEFTVIEIKDLLHGANQNLKTNNIKATNLIHSYNTFKVANTLTGIIAVLICCSLLFAKPNNNSLTIENPIELKNFDSTMHAVMEKIDDKKIIIEYKHCCKEDSLCH